MHEKQKKKQSSIEESLSSISGKKFRYACCLLAH